ncbi:uncharacterized protein [Primulina huaijiensis]|uniref:uncharacterized protein n=1 Tax=Primulina huaijiensis TaxID=1492673 RepID=UPI003CC78E7F
MPLGQGEFVVYTDASRLNLDTVLMQHDRVITYASRQSKVHEKNYPNHELEPTAVVFALKIWRHYLFGEKCRIFTGHKSLKNFFTQKELNTGHRRKHAVISHFSVQRSLQMESQRFELAFNAKGDAPNLAALTVKPTLRDRIRVKEEHQRLAGKLRSLPIPEWKWDNITMDLVTGLPRTTGSYNAIWVASVLGRGRRDGRIGSRYCQENYRVGSQDSG